MSNPINKRDVEVDSNEQRDVWSLINPRTMGQSVGVLAGVVSYKPLAEEVNPEAGPPHQVPEVLYITSGSGTILLNTRRVALSAGDAILIPPGVPHRVWANGPDDMVACYFELEEAK